MANLHRDLRYAVRDLRRAPLFTVVAVVSIALGTGAFPVPGVGAAVGRVITPEDDRVRAGHPVAVLSYEYWRTRFGADPGVIGKTIVVNNYPLTIIGVSQSTL